MRKRGVASRREDAPNQYFPILYDPNNGDISTDQTASYPVQIFPKLSDGNDGRWRWAKQNVDDKKENLLIRLVNRQGGGQEYDVFEKDYFSEDKKSKIKSIIYEKFANYEDASDTIRQLFDGKKIFDYPKPERLLAYLIKSVSDSGIVLGVFSGSGSTAHAVMQLNAEDGGNRQFIIAQLPEPSDEKSEAFKSDYETIAAIGKERIRRVAAKIKKEKPGYDGDLGFKVFKLDSTNIKSWEVGSNLTEKTLEDYISNIKPDRREEDILYEVLLKRGLVLTLPITEHTIDGRKVFDVDKGKLLICLSDSISLELASGIAKLKDESNLEIKWVVFKDSGFENDMVKTNAFLILKQSCIDVTSL